MSGENETRPRSLRPDRICHNDLRGGQIQSVSAQSITVKLHLEHNIVGTRTILRSLLPAGVGADIGAPVILRVTGGGADTYIVTEVIGARFVPPGPGDQIAAVQRGEFWPGAIPPEERYWW